MQYLRVELTARLVITLATLTCATTSESDEALRRPFTGVVKGRVVYKPDPARPWRFQRYFVKKPATGELAEAVVALRGRELRSCPSLSEGDEPRTIDQFNYQFVPETTAIRAGDRITFTNSDLTTHNIKSTADIAPFNVNLEAEDEYTHEFSRAGGMTNPVTLGCVYHGGMRAWIYVFDHPFFAITESDGEFRFEHVPPGRYTLELVHPAGQLRWKGTITVPEFETATVEIQLSPDNRTLD